MDKKYNKWQSFLLNIVYIAIIFISVKLISNVIEIEITLLNQLIIVIIISLLAKFFVKHPIFFIITLTISFIVLLAIDIYKMPILLPIGDKISSVFSNIIENLRGKETILNENKSLVFIIITLFLSSYTSISIFRLKKISLLLPPYIFIFLSYWYNFIDRAYTTNIIFISLFLILLAFKGYSSSKFKNNEIFNRWIRTSIIYSLIIISLASLLPKNIDYINWPWLQTKVYEKFPIVDDLRHYKDYNSETSTAELFSFSTTGFSEVESELGGPLVQSEKKIMTVESDNPVYLRGNAKHFYTGRTWKNQSTNLKEYNSNDNFNLPSKQERELFYAQENIIVNFDSFKSNTIFAPYKALRINSNNISTILVDEDEIVSTNEGLYKDESYLVSFIKPLSYEALKETKINEIRDLQNLDSYLQIPEDTITDRTKELTRSLVNETDNDYDKAIKIQDHLRNNYKYELDTILLPKSEEFIDHFLFQKQEGYCTYYASSMAIMLRLEGIPTRYIEGFIVNEKIDEDKYQVRQKHAHTWVEAFIQPLGWIVFEPTPVYEPIEDVVVDQEEKKEDFKEDMIPEKDDLPDKALEDINTPLDDGSHDINIETDKKNIHPKKIFLNFVSIILLLLLIRIFTRHLKYKGKEKYLKSLKNKDKVIYLYKDIVDILSILAFPMKFGETHFEYANRIGYKFTDLKDYGIKDITDIFVSIKYSTIEATEDNVHALLQYRILLNERLKNTLGKNKYFYRKYINIYFKKRKEIP